MKPGDVVTFTGPHSQSREAEYGPGPYILDRRVPDNYWVLARMKDGVVHDRTGFQEKTFQVCAFLTAARKAIHETEV